jgi:5-methylcytosine-specific restriction endonuclease McrA
VLRKGRKYSPEEILPRVKFPLWIGSIFVPSSREDLDGDQINFSTLRLRTFAAKGITCVACKLRGLFFIKEKQRAEVKRYHLALYALDKNGQEVLMTKDHIIPKSRGGKNTLRNMQPMCLLCNQEKGDNSLSKEEEEDQ